MSTGMDVMEPTTPKNELHSALVDAGTSSAEKVHGAMYAHRQRRERAIAHATQSMALRVSRTSSTRTRGLRAWPHLVAACALVVVVALFGLQQSNDAWQVGQADSLVTHLEPLQRGSTDADLDPLVDRLVRRSSQGPEWMVTDADVDQLLGDFEIDL